MRDARTTRPRALASSPPPPNASEAIAGRLAGGILHPRTVWAVLLLRPVMALGMQSVFAAGYALAGDATPWSSAAAWWMTSFALGEAGNLALLVALARREGLRYRDLLHARGGGVGRDLLWLLVVGLVSGPVAMFPNLWLATALWGDPSIAAGLLFRPLPVCAAWATLLGFPIVHAMTELPTYFGYVMPRLRAMLGRAPALALCACVLSVQHVFLPFLLDGRMIVYRALMFLPFALWIGFAVDRRPTVLPWLAGLHVLLDVTLPWFVLQASLAAQ